MGKPLMIRAYKDLDEPIKKMVDEQRYRVYRNLEKTVKEAQKVLSESDGKPLTEKKAKKNFSKIRNILEEGLTRMKDGNYCTLNDVMIKISKKQFICPFGINC